MVTEPIDETYFNWLYDKVVPSVPRSPSNSYVRLLSQLYSTEFIWLVHGDDNRVEDGLSLRDEFYFLLQNRPDLSGEVSLGCSVLEVLISFARRAAYQTSINERDWFWIFLKNLDIHDLPDASADFEEYVDQILSSFIFRTYKRNGEGGLFPIVGTRTDQRKIEICYQFYEYIENEGIV